MPLARISKAGRENIAVGHHGKEFGLENKVKWKKKRKTDRIGQATLQYFLFTGQETWLVVYRLCLGLFYARKERNGF